MLKGLGKAHNVKSDSRKQFADSETSEETGSPERGVSGRQGKNN